jgi:hypothetical protein
MTDSHLYCDSFISQGDREIIGVKMIQEDDATLVMAGDVLSCQVVWQHWNDMDRPALSELPIPVPDSSTIFAVEKEIFWELRIQQRKLIAVKNPFNQTGLLAYSGSGWPHFDAHYAMCHDVVEAMRLTAKTCSTVALPIRTVDRQQKQNIITR